ncbi:acetate--CoA ligase, partial [Thermodesulfobacteriota bacterium]
MTMKDLEEYRSIYEDSIKDPEAFWDKQAKKLLSWHRPWEQVLKYDFNKGEIAWFSGGKLNVSYNCLDRHVQTWRKNKAAIIFEGERIGDSRTYTYQDLYYEVNKFANVLKKHGVRKGDRVAIYLPMIPELPVSMLACCRIGAVHSVIFGGFSSESLRTRINDCRAKILITSDGGFRGGKVITLKRNADEATQGCPSIKKVVVVKRTGWEVPMISDRDLWYHHEMRAPDIAPYCPPRWVDAEDPLFILYTSGSTGQPKGVLHTTGGYLLYAAYTFSLVFDYQEEDTMWCTADIGWVTGHTYLVYGPLASGASSVLFEGIPTYPGFDRFWDVVEKYGVNLFYTAPTAIRALRKEGDTWVKKHDLKSLRILGSVGEPINPEAWKWYHEVVGGGRCPVVDTWWQTETGGILISPMPNATPLKPGSATLPLPGVHPVLLDDQGREIQGPGEGLLCIKSPWPGITRGLY